MTKPGDMSRYEQLAIQIRNAKRRPQRRWELPEYALNFDFVTSNVAVGSAINSPKDVQALKEAGFTHVINCQQEFDDRRLLGSVPGVWLGVPDDNLPKPPAWYKAGVEFARTALAGSRRKLYVHCYAGINRSSGMAYAILRGAFGMTRQEATRAVLGGRKKALPTYFADADAALLELGLAS